MTSNENPSLYTWGTDKSGCLLQQELANNEIVWAPQKAAAAKVLGTTRIATYSCGVSEIMLVTADGRVWVAGENKNGQLGVGHKNPVPTLTELKVGDHEDDIEMFQKGVVGSNTGALIANNGDLYTFGFGGSPFQGVGCLGHGDGESYLRPKLVESLVEDGCKVKDVTLGESHTTGKDFLN